MDRSDYPWHNWWDIIIIILYKNILFNVGSDPMDLQLINSLGDGESDWVNSLRDGESDWENSLGDGKNDWTNALGDEDVTESIYLGMGRLTWGWRDWLRQLKWGWGVTESIYLGMRRVIETTHLVIGRTIDAAHLGQAVFLAMGIESETTASQTPDKLQPHRQQLSPRQRDRCCEFIPIFGAANEPG